jgi:hypothetical protein
MIHDKPKRHSFNERICKAIQLKIANWSFTCYHICPVQLGYLILSKTASSIKDIYLETIQFVYNIRFSRKKNDGLSLLTW